jgi:hypothetical protein
VAHSSKNKKVYSCRIYFNSENKKNKFHKPRKGTDEAGRPLKGEVVISDSLQSTAAKKGEVVTA